MPVDFTPVVVLFFAIAVPLCLALMRWFRTSVVVILLEALLLAVYLLIIYIPGWRLQRVAKLGDPVAQFQFSRWRRSVRIAGQDITDLSDSVYWLKESAKQKYPPAIYALGVMYKFGKGIPGISATNAEPIKGQALIDQALVLGFQPSIRENWFYDAVYAVTSHPISPGAPWLQGHPGSGAPTSSWSMPRSMPPHGTANKPPPTQNANASPTTVTTQDQGKPALRPVVYEAHMVGVDFERRILISPRGKIRTVIRPAHGAVKITRGQLNDAQIIKLVRCFKGWEKLQPHYSVGGRDGLTTTIRYGSKSVTDDQTLNVPPLFRKVCRQIELLAAQQAPTTAPTVLGP